MNKILQTTLIAVIFLSGCAAINTFDSEEYTRANNITTLAELAKDNCRNIEALKPQIASLYVATVDFKNYVRYIPDNTFLQEPAEKMLAMVTELRNKDSVMSPAYCEIKLTIIRDTSAGLQKVAGSKGKQ